MSLAVVEVAFGVLPFDDTTLDVASNWTTVSTDVREFDYATSARSDRFAVFVAGRGTIRLDNTSRTYDPDHATGTHFGDFKRNVPARIIGVHELGTASFDFTGGALEDLWTFTAHGLAVGDRVQFSAAGAAPSEYAADTDYYVVTVNDANTFQLSATLGGAVLAGTADDSGTWTLTVWCTQFYGYSKTWTPDYTMPTESATELTMTDGLGLLAQFDLAEIQEAHGGDYIGDRIDRILDSFGWPSGYRDIDSGVELQATEFDINGLRHIQKAAQSVDGRVYAQRDGVLTFDAYECLTSTRQTTSQVTVGHQAAPTQLNDGSFQMAGVGQGYRDLVVIKATGVASTAVTVDNTVANEAPTVFRKSDLLHAHEPQSEQTAQFYADLYGTETPHPQRARVVAKTINADVNTALFNRRIRDRITVELDPPGAGSDISHECFIDGISGKGRDGIWEITYRLSSAEAYDDNLASAPTTWMILDSATQGQLNTDTLGY